LRQWGIAAVLSDETSELPGGFGIGYNKGGVFSYTGYSLGSINLYNYNYSGYDGPYFYQGMGALSNLSPASNIYVDMGKVSSNTMSWTVTLPANVDMTVIVR
jgi:hypothetical protein